MTIAQLPLKQVCPISNNVLKYLQQLFGPTPIQSLAYVVTLARPNNITNKHTMYAAACYLRLSCNCNLTK